jgi:general stress protein CsbA
MKLNKIYNDYNINKLIYFYMNLSVLFSQCTFSRFGDVAWAQVLLTSLCLRRTTLSVGT